MANYVRALVDMYLPEQSEGQGMVEYALILGLVSVVAIAVLLLFGEPLTAILEEVLGALETGAGAAGGGT